MPESGSILINAALLKIRNGKVSSDEVSVKVRWVVGQVNSSISAHSRSLRSRCFDCLQEKPQARQKEEQNLLQPNAGPRGETALPHSPLFRDNSLSEMTLLRQTYLSSIDCRSTNWGGAK